MTAAALPGSSDQHDAPLKVSIVVPVYNAGDHLQRCAPSLLQQSMSPREYEVIYVDDGSTDDSPAQLAAVRAAHPHVVVLSQPGSGWPGRPRNVGIDHARGVYVQFVDQDDRLGLRALERLWALASPGFPDIVLGKVGGGMSNSNLLFKRNIAHGDHTSIPAIDSLTAHKMFRRQFLLDHDIRFPEGYWRGEDLLFMARAYTRVTDMAVLADYVCYYWDRHDNGHHSAASYELAGHYDRLRQIIETLRDGTEPGDLQDRLLRRLYRVEVMSRLRGVRADTLDDPTLRESYELSRTLARDCFPVGVRQGMPAVPKLEATVLEQGDLVATSELNERTAALTPRVERQVRLSPDGSLHAHLRLRLTRPGSRPLTLVRRDDRWFLDPQFVGQALPGGELEVSDPTAYAHAELQVFDPEAHVWWYPEGSLEVGLREVDRDVFALVAEGDMVLDPRTAAAGRPLPPADYWVWVVAELLGVGKWRRLVMPGAGGPGAQRGVWVSTSKQQVVRYDWTLDEGRVRLQVRARGRWLERNLAPGEVSPSAAGGRMDVPVVVRSRHAAGSSKVRAHLRSGGTGHAVRAVLTVQPSGRAGSLRLRGLGSVPDGRYSLSLGPRSVVLATVRVREGAVVQVRPAGEARWQAALATVGGEDVRRLAARLRRVVGRGLRRRPSTRRR